MRKLQDMGNLSLSVTRSLVTVSPICIVFLFLIRITNDFRQVIDTAAARQGLGIDLTYPFPCILL